MTEEMHACRCGLATRLVGDGCEHCNPQMTIDILREQIADMRLTDAERFVLREVRDICANEEDIASHERAAVIDGLLERTR